MLLSYAGSRREGKHNLGYILPCLFCRIHDVTLLPLPPLHLGYISWPESTVFDTLVRTYQRAGRGEQRTLAVKGIARGTEAISPRYVIASDVDPQDAAWRRDHILR